MLTHSSIRFAAPSSADSGSYNYGTYWMFNSLSIARAYEQQLGGPPYGQTLKNTLEFAPAFKADNVRTPLLMEYTRSPKDVLAIMEFFVALKKQNRPVELFYYPRGEHDLDTPFERVASLQRNVDWFRFWMQGKEGSLPSYDPEQFVRWRELRKLQGASAKPDASSR